MARLSRVLPTCSTIHLNNPTLTDPQYAFMKTNAAAINTNLKPLWISMGGQEDIAYQNCQVMTKKFDEMGIKYQYSEYAGGHP